jgi:hypothetical protein
MNIGRDRFNKSWTNLVKLGYIVSVKMIDVNSNLIKGYNHVVYEEPVLDLLNLGLPENQATRNSECIQSNKEQSNNIQINNIKNNILDTSSRTSIENFEIDMFSKEAQKMAELELDRLLKK